jgi:hypothetical protein
VACEREYGNLKRRLWEKEFEDRGCPGTGGEEYMCACDCESLDTDC